MFNVIFFTEDTDGSLKTSGFDLRTVKIGSEMFYESQIESFTSDLSSLTNGNFMFYRSAISSFEGDLSSLTNGTNMFNICTNLTSFNSNLSSLTNGGGMFYDCYKLTTFTSDLSSLIEGSQMFRNCTNLTTFTSDLSSLTNGTNMFHNCTNLTSFNSNLSSLTDGDSMFESCSKLTTFTSDLSSLIEGSEMFYGCSNLRTFECGDLSSLTNGFWMFYKCSNLTSFTSDLSSLTNGYQMFINCSNLTSFTSDLSSLTNGSNMFSQCKLDAKSVRYIVQSLPTRTLNTSLAIGINVSSSTVNGKNTQQQLLEFANEIGYDTWAALKKAFTDKKWSVTFQYGGTSSSITYDLREGITPQEELPIYVKVIAIEPQDGEYTKEQKETAMYCSSDGSKLYDLDWGHDVTNPEQYGIFSCIEEAYGYYDVIPKEFLEEIEEEQEQIEQE